MFVPHNDFAFVQYVAMACIFVAGKIEENCRRVRDVANVFHHLKQKRMGRYAECFCASVIVFALEGGRMEWGEGASMMRW